MPRTKKGPRTNVTKKAGIVNVEQIYIDSRPHYCSCCGKEYDKQSGNFTPTRSQIYAGNGGYSTICNTCRDGWYDEIYQITGSEEASVERVCQLLDITYDPALIAYEANKEGHSRFGSYITRLNLMQARKSKAITYTDSYKELIKAKKTEVRADAYRLFGRKYSASEYEDLQAFYEDVAEYYGEPENSQVASVYAALAQLEYQRVLAGKGSPKDLTDIVKQKLDLVTKMGLKPKEERDGEKEEKDLGSLIRSIEEYAPAEYYADKKRYRDFFGIDKYIERFILRPMRNMMLGMREEDPEFSVGDDGDVRT